MSKFPFHQFKEIFLCFHDLLEFFELHGFNLILKTNEFYSSDEFTKFQFCFHKLAQLGFIRSYSEDRTEIYLHDQGELHIKCKIARVQRLTESGQSIINVLPLRQELISVY